MEIRLSEIVLWRCKTFEISVQTDTIRKSADRIRLSFVRVLSVTVTLNRHTSDLPLVGIMDPPERV
jgi:hypothetical protein